VPLVGQHFVDLVGVFPEAGLCCVALFFFRCDGVDVRVEICVCVYVCMYVCVCMCV
jgi:hypothetical protein